MNGGMDYWRSSRRKAYKNRTAPTSGTNKNKTVARRAPTSGISAQRTDKRKNNPQDRTTSFAFPSQARNETLFTAGLFNKTSTNAPATAMMRKTCARLPCLSGKMSPHVTAYNTRRYSANRAKESGPNRNPSMPDPCFKARLNPCTIPIRTKLPKNEPSTTRGSNWELKPKKREPTTAHPYKAVFHPLLEKNPAWLSSILPESASKTSTGTTNASTGCQKKTSVRNSRIEMPNTWPNAGPAETGYPDHKTFVIGASYKANKQPQTYN